MLPVLLLLDTFEMLKIKFFKKLSTMSRLNNCFLLLRMHLINLSFFLVNQIVPPHEFERGLKLEAVNPVSPNQVCAATITKLSDRLLWIHLDSNVKVVASHIEDIESHNLFPVGWCESNGYQLKPPRKGSSKPGKRVAVVQPE